MRQLQTTVNHYSVVSRDLGCNPMYIASVVKHIGTSNYLSIISRPVCVSVSYTEVAKNEEGLGIIII